MTKKEFLETVEDFLKKTGMAPSAFGMKSFGDPNLVFGLRLGRECREKTQGKVLNFINNYEEKATCSKN